MSSGLFGCSPGVGMYLAEGGREEGGREEGGPREVERAEDAGSVEQVRLPGFALRAEWHCCMEAAAIAALC